MMYSTTTSERNQDIKICAKYVRSLFESERLMVALYRNMEKDSGGTYFKVTGTGMITNRACILHGAWKRHPKYGNSFEVSYTEDIPAPQETENLVNYLTDMKIKGLGIKTAKRIVDFFQDKTLEAMQEPTALTKIKGISLKKANDIVKEWNDRKEVRPWYDLFVEMKLLPWKAPKAYSLLGKKYSINTIRENPYLLCNVGCLSFKEIDDAVMQFPDGTFFYTDKHRIYSGLVYCMLVSENKGNVFADKEWLIHLAMKQLFPNDFAKNELVRFYLQEMIREGTFVLVKNAVFRKRLYKAESGSAELLSNLLTHPRKRIASDVLDELMDEVDKNRVFSDEQKQAILQAFTENVSIITGGPGTGKTFCLRAILKISQLLSKKYQTQENRIVLCAPTGRAARRMEENAEFPASTIHHALMLTDDGVFASSPEPLEADMVIVDEFSMVGTELFYSLLRCIKPGTSLVIIGDKDQLPSVTAGNVLNDLIASRCIKTSTLTRFFRQEAGSSIIHNAYRIKHYEQDPRSYTGENFLELDQSTEFIPVKSENECLEWVLKKVNEQTELYGKDQVQVLTPLRKKTEVSTRNLNKKLQDIFNPLTPSSKELARGERIFRTGDRVIHLKNLTDNYCTYSNGDIGKIFDIHESNKEIMVTFDENRTKQYEGAELDQLEHAFAMTVHKSQGSEYDVVILPFIKEFAGMRVKNLLYTAVSRAKKKLIIIGDMDSVFFAATHSGDVRNTFLKEQLCYRAMSGDKNSTS